MRDTLLCAEHGLLEFCTCRGRTRFSRLMLPIFGTSESSDRRPDEGIRVSRARSGKMTGVNGGIQHDDRFELRR